MAASHDSSTTSNQLNNQHDQRYDQQQMDQGAANMSQETEKPENQ